jgi:hypothetical protein
MTKPDSRIPARRQFFRGVLRSVSLTLLGAAGGAAAMKRRRLVRENKCDNQGVCSGCEVFDECGLPRALSVKQVTAGSRDDR